MDQLILVMYSNLVDIPEKLTGDDPHGAINGLSLEFFFYGANGEMVASRISAGGVSGMRRGKGFLSPELSNKVSYVPGIYNGTFEMNVDSKGKSVLKLLDIDFVAKASITVLEDEKSKAAGTAPEDESSKKASK